LYEFRAALDQQMVIRRTLIDKTIGKKVLPAMEEKYQKQLDVLGNVEEGIQKIARLRSGKK